MACNAAPTLSGESVLNPFHPYGTVRHLHNKPASGFIDDDQYLLIAAAEKEGLLKVTFKVQSSSAHPHARSCPKCIKVAKISSSFNLCQISHVWLELHSFMPDQCNAGLAVGRPYHHADVAALNAACLMLASDLLFRSKADSYRRCRHPPLDTSSTHSHKGMPLLRLSQADCACVQVLDQQAMDQTADMLLEQTKELYCSQSVSTTARAWNELRQKVLVDALDNIFKVQFERELRVKLMSEAREHACVQCTRHVWKLAVEGPIAVRLLLVVFRTSFLSCLNTFCNVY